MLLAAQRSYEERKVPYHGRLLSGIAFDSSISHTEANHLLRVFDALSYQQFVLLQLFRVGILTRADDWRGKADSIPPHLVHVLTESVDLFNRGLINLSGDVMLGLTDLKPAAARTQGVGVTLLHACGIADLAMLAVTTDSSEMPTSIMTAPRRRGHVPPVWSERCLRRRRSWP